MQNLVGCYLFGKILYILVYFLVRQISTLYPDYSALQNAHSYLKFSIRSAIGNIQNLFKKPSQQTLSGGNFEDEEEDKDMSARERRDWEQGL